MLCVAIVMYEISEVVQLTYHIAATTEKAAIKMWQDLVDIDRPSRKLMSMECIRLDHPSQQSHISGRPRLALVTTPTEGEDDGPVPSDS